MSSQEHRNDVALDLGLASDAKDTTHVRPEPRVITLRDLTLEKAGSTVPPETAADQEFFIPIHGFVELTPDEVAIVNHPAFQRLGMVYQLGQAHLVYRGATHKRFEHVLGTLYVAEEMIQALQRNHARAQRRTSEVDESPWADPLSFVERTFIRLAALLHDVGHLPEGHTLEDELGFLEKHDSHARIMRVLQRNAWPGGATQPLAEVINSHYSSSVSTGAASPLDVLLQIIARDPPGNSRSDVAKVVRIELCRDIVGNTICADLLDYLHRDWYHIGKPKHFDRRLFHYLEIRDDAKGTPNLVISLGRRPKIRTDAISAILNLLEARYELAESVLFHRTKCSAAAMLERALHELLLCVPENDRDAWRLALEDRLLDLTDEGLIQHLAEEASTLKASAAALPLEGLQQRRLYRGVSTTFWSELPGDVAQKLIARYTRGPNAAEERNRAVRLLEEDFGLPRGSLAVYCPDKGMNAKIANVKIHVGGWIDTLAKWDQENRDFGGGHLEAQLHRFTRLWRVHVCLEQREWDRLGEDMRQLLRQAIQTCVLGVTLPQTPLEASVRYLASALSTTKGSPYHGQTARKLVGARGGQPISMYPSGAPRIQSYFADS